MSDTKNIVVFLDNINRTIMGSIVEDNDTHLLVKNPAVVHVVPNPPQLQLQILPLFFKEFQKDRNSDLVWKFNKNNIVTCQGMELSEQFISQYLQLCGVAPTTPPAEPEVIKLFDE